MTPKHIIQTIALTSLFGVSIAIANPELTNTEATNVDTAPERTAWKTALELENVDNTSDLNKPVSTATQSALDAQTHVSADITDATSDAMTNPEKILKSGSGGTLELSRVTVGNASGVAGLMIVYDGLGLSAGINAPTLTDNQTLSLPDGTGYAALTSQTDGTITTADIADTGDTTDAFLTDTMTPTQEGEIRERIGAVGLTGNEPIGGDKTFSDQVTLTGQLADGPDKAMTLGLVESIEKFRTNQNTFLAYTSAASGTGASATNDFFALGRSRLIAGTATGGFAYSNMARSPMIEFGSGTGIKFSTPFAAKGSFLGAPSAGSEGVYRFLIGGVTGTPALADAAAFTGFGLGFEIRTTSAGLGNTVQAQIIYHDGTAYKQGGWVTVVDQANSTVGNATAFCLVSDGSGNVSLYMQSEKDNGVPSLIGTTPIDTIIDGPTGNTGNTNAFVKFANVNSSSAYTAGTGNLAPSPITFITDF